MGTLAELLNAGRKAPPTEVPLASKLYAPAPAPAVCMNREDIKLANELAAKQARFMEDKEAKENAAREAALKEALEAAARTMEARAFSGRGGKPMPPTRAVGKDVRDTRDERSSRGDREPPSRPKTGAAEAREREQREARERAREKEAREREFRDERERAKERERAELERRKWERESAAREKAQELQAIRERELAAALAQEAAEEAARAQEEKEAREAAARAEREAQRLERVERDELEFRQARERVLRPVRGIQDIRGTRETRDARDNFKDDGHFDSLDTRHSRERSSRHAQEAEDLRGSVEKRDSHEVALLLARDVRDERIRRDWCGDRREPRDNRRLQESRSIDRGIPSRRRDEEPDTRDHFGVSRRDSQGGRHSSRSDQVPDTGRGSGGGSHGVSRDLVHVIDNAPWRSLDRADKGPCGSYGRDREARGRSGAWRLSREALDSDPVRQREQKEVESDRRGDYDDAGSLCADTRGNQDSDLGRRRYVDDGGRRHTKDRVDRNVEYIGRSLGREARNPYLDDDGGSDNRYSDQRRGHNDEFLDTSARDQHVREGGGGSGRYLARAETHHSNRYDDRYGDGFGEKETFVVDTGWQYSARGGDGRWDRGSPNAISRDDGRFRHHSNGERVGCGGGAELIAPASNRRAPLAVLRARALPPGQNAAARADSRETSRPSRVPDYGYSDQGWAQRANTAAAQDRSDTGDACRAVAGGGTPMEGRGGYRDEGYRAHNDNDGDEGAYRRDARSLRTQARHPSRSRSLAGAARRDGLRRHY